MVISKTIINLLNYRIQQEEQSSRIYKAMSVWLNLNGYTGASKLWGSYSKEELDHADWAYKYLLDLNLLPVTPSQEEPEIEFKGLPQIIALTMKHELDITNQCKDLSMQCLRENDIMTFGLAQKYVEEQINEIAKAQLWIDKLNAFGEDKIALRLLDEEMGKL